VSSNKLAILPYDTSITPSVPDCINVSHSSDNFFEGPAVVDPITFASLGKNPSYS